ncbi:hypothetical protein FKP32DRAFT_1234364 [Trametes sanguinea]|nr:hypothetical protein FKP32DRAFT_1234364 [Trametes sanguinea]
MGDQAALTRATALSIMSYEGGTVKERQVVVWWRQRRGPEGQRERESNVKAEDSRAGEREPHSQVDGGRSASEKARACDVAAAEYVRGREGSASGGSRVRELETRAEKDSAGEQRGWNVPSARCDKRATLAFSVPSRSRPFYPLPAGHRSTYTY